MMVIDVRKLNAQKKYAGNMEFSYSAPQALIEIPFVEFDGDVKVTFDYELYEDNSLEINGSVSYRLTGKCSKCLEAATQEVEGEIHALFEDRKDYVDYGYSNGIIHLETAVEDAIMASMPFTLSCGEACKGLSWTEADHD